MRDFCDQSVILCGDRNCLHPEVGEGVEDPLPVRTGLGLAIVQRIVFDHGGNVWAQSDGSRGTTFFIDLPADTTGPAPVMNPPGASATPSAAHNPPSAAHNPPSAARRTEE